MKADFPNLKRYASENIKLQSSTNNGKRVVFFGDSITEFWTPRRSLLFKNPNIINRGISGQTTSQMVLRFEDDVVKLQPSTVIILAGINDIAENAGPVSVEAIFQNIVSMVEITISNGIKVILCSVLPSNSISWRNDIAPADKIIQLNEMISGYANEYVISYVDYYHAMVNSSKGLDKKYSHDGLHPNMEGYKKMEEIISPFL